MVIIKKSALQGLKQISDHTKIYIIVVIGTERVNSQHLAAVLNNFGRVHSIFKRNLFSYVFCKQLCIFWDCQ